MADLNSIDLRIGERLRDREFRREWFRAELEQGVPEQFKALREARHWTQTNLAEETGMKQSAISRFEKSTDANWNFETLLTMAEAMDAQLQINLVRAEIVIEEMERREGDAEQDSAGESVLKAAEKARSRDLQDRKSYQRERDNLSATDPTPPPPQALRNLVKDEGNRPWK